MGEEFINQLTDLGAVGLFLAYLIHANHQAAKRLTSLSERWELQLDKMRETIDEMADKVAESSRIQHELQQQQHMALAMKAARAKTVATIPIPTPPPPATTEE